MLFMHFMVIPPKLAIPMAAALLALARPAAALMDYDPRSDTIWVSDFPAAHPCTPARLLAADRAGGWAKISYDPASDTYTVRCRLAVGAADGSDTFFQVGAPGAPRETLVLHAPLVVQPYWIAGASDAKWWDMPARVNRVTLGCPDDTNVCAVLVCATNTSLTTGVMADGRAGRGGQLFVYHSRITALDPARGFGMPFGGRIESLRQAGGDAAVFVGAHVSHARGHVGSGIGGDAHALFRAERTVFADYGALLPSAGVFQSCVFEDAAETAIRDWGSLNATLVDCVFRHNARHWELTYSDKGLTLIDCQWDEPRDRDQYRMHTDTNGRRHTPTLTVRRHLVVAVTDAAGAPVPGARVSVAADQDGAGEIPRPVATDAAGRTPGKGLPDALLLTERIRTATETPNQPVTREFSYAVTAAKDGRTAARAGIRPTSSWEIVTLAWPAIARP